MLVACGSSSTDTAAPDADGDAGALAADDASAPAAMTPPAPYPAFAYTNPKEISDGGKVIASPKLALLVFPNDPMTAIASTFVSAIGASDYWATATKEYGVGPTTALPVVTITDTVPSTIDDKDIKTWLAGRLDGTHPEMPPPDGQTIYVVLFPAGITVTAGSSTGCVDLGGYHAEAPLAGGASAPYVVIPRCTTFLGQTGADLLTVAMSHELIEASLNPLIRSAPAFGDIDQSHLAWAGFEQLEPSDLCGGEFTRPATFDFMVQRSWSNLAARVGHDPCVPSGALPYFISEPVVGDIVKLPSFSVPSVKIAVGDKRTIKLQLSSEGPLDDWTIEVGDAAVVNHGLAQLAFKLPVTTGHNGDVLDLTISAIRPGRVGKLTGVSSFYVVSKAKDGRQTVAAALVSN